VPPACFGQSQSSFTRNGPAARNQDAEILVQSSRIEIGERPGKRRVGMVARSRKPTSQETHHRGRGFGPRHFGIKECHADIKVASLPGQPGQRTQVLERAPHTAPRRSLRGHRQGHAQAARSDPDLVNRLFFAGLGAGQIGKQPLHVLTQELRGGLPALLFLPFHELRVWNEKHRRTRPQTTREYNGAMKLKKLVQETRRFCQPYCIREGKDFRLKDIDPSDTRPLNKARAKNTLAMGIEALAKLQDILSAQDSWAVLLIFQAMDAAGKDGAIKHVMSGINPQGCQVASFKAPSAEELDHDYLWRCQKHLPERGRIGIFNRSYYEEALVVRVHPELLEKQKLPRQVVDKKIWEHRFEDICAFERYLARNGIAICKFFLHVSHAEQKRRFLERLDTPEKNWKFSTADIAERQHWREYMVAYEDMIRATATPWAPWYVVPADHKWFTRAVVAGAVIDAMASLDLKYPVVDKAKRAELAAARTELLPAKASTAR
jgi:PPK2 family polyphosphate:nucleotide phosphotransferase